MLQAVETPFLKVAAVAGAAVIVGMLALAPHATCGAATVQRLELHAPQEPNAIYLTAFRDGDVYVRLRSDDARTLTFETRAKVWDGCTWLATETLVPDGENRYAYSYDERVLSCEPGSTPTRKTPRTGYVLALPPR